MPKTSKMPKTIHVKYLGKKKHRKVFMNSRRPTQPFRGEVISKSEYRTMYKEHMKTRRKVSNEWLRIKRYQSN